mgnify:CR=1 FL=1
MDEKKPVIACPKRMVDVVIEDTKRLSDWTQALIRDYSKEEYDWAWSNYHSEVTVLCEYYVSALGLYQYMNDMTETRVAEKLDDGTEYFVLSNSDLALISNLMNTMRFCESELADVHNISLQLN